jgi:asparaginyl-tRNA synthetase
MAREKQEKKKTESKEIKSFISIQEALDKKKGQVAIRGWVHREAKMKDKIFIVLRDSSNILQCVIKEGQVSKDQWQALQKVLVESSMELEGTIREDKRSPTGYEVDVTDLRVVGYAEPYPITKEINEELLLDRRHLWLRSRKMTAIMKIRSTVLEAIHEFYHSRGFYEYQSPIFQSVQCEGGSTLFEVKYFDTKTYLAQTWQLYAEPAIFALEKIYTIAPTFRAEESKTSRHLTEFWMHEMEVAWASFKEIQDYGESLIKHIVKKVLEKNKQDLEILNRDAKKLEPTLKKPFPRITYDEAIKLLEKKGVKISWGKDLRTLEEDKLSELYDTPIIVTNYPKEVKAFYMREDEKNPKVVHGFDCIAPEHFGEIIGGSEREPDLEKLKKRLKEMGEKIEKYSFYLDTRRYGSVPHGGFGMGVERLLAWICGLESIKDTIAFPRTINRSTP